MDDDNTSWITTISPSHMPATHAAIFKIVLFIANVFQTYKDNKITT